MKPVSGLKTLNYYFCLITLPYQWQCIVALSIMILLGLDGSEKLCCENNECPWSRQTFDYSFSKGSSMGSIFNHTSLGTSVWSTCVFDVLLITAIGRRRQRLQMFPHHQLAETAPVATRQPGTSILPGVLYFGWFADTLGIFVASASCCLAEFSTRSFRGKKATRWHTKSWRKWGPIDEINLVTCWRFPGKISVSYYLMMLLTLDHLWWDTSQLLHCHCVFNVPNHENYRFNCTVLFSSVLLHNNGLLWSIF